MNEHRYAQLIDQAQQYAHDGKWLHVSQIYQRLIAEHPDAFELYFQLANAFFELRNVTAAENVLLNALKKDRSNSDVLFALGVLHFKADDYDNALHYFDQLIPLRSPHVHFNIALIFIQKKIYSNAERHLRLVAEYEPSYPDLFITLGDVLVKSEKPREAIEVLRGVIERAPDNWYAHYLFAIASMMTMHWTAAHAALQRGRTLAPNNAELSRLHADVMMHLGEHEEAEELLHHAHALDPESAEIELSWARLALLRNNKKLARKHFERALERDGTHERALEGLNLLLIGADAD